MCISQVVLKECFIPLTPVWFSSEMLGAMDKIKPSDLSSPVKAAPRDKKKSNVRYQQRVVFKRTKSQALQRMVVDASLCSSSVVEEVVQQEATPRPLVDASLSCSSGVEKAVQEEPLQRMVVDASLCSSSFVEEVVQQEATPRPLVDASLSCSSGVEKAVQEEATQRMVVDASLCSSSFVEEVVQQEATPRPLADASLSCSSGVEKVVQEEATQRMVVDASLRFSSVVEEVVQQEVTQRPVVDASLSCSSGVKDAVQEELPGERTSRMEHAAKISPKRIQSKTIGNANTSMCYVLEGDVTCNSFLTDMNTAYDSYAHTDSSSINVHPISFGAPSDALECQRRSVNGSFHQGDSRLNHPGKQI
ncbi:uncharacterized protein LOC144033700 isoform X1 [Festucalex cinctus]